MACGSLLVKKTIDRLLLSKHGAFKHLLHLLDGFIVHHSSVELFVLTSFYLGRPEWEALKEMESNVYLAVRIVGCC